MSDFKKNLELALGNAKRLSNKILIDGKLVSAKVSGKIKVINPSTGETIGEVPQCDKNDVNTVVDFCRKSFSKMEKNTST